MKLTAGFLLGTATLLVALPGFGATSERERDGEKAYRAHCATCHETGANGAPAIHNTSDWAERSNLWESVLFEHARKGYLKMPAKGGDVQVSDYDVGAAAEYMLNITHPDLPRD